MLLAIASANHRFIAVDVGSYGSEGDAGTFTRSKMGQHIDGKTFKIPPPKALPGTNVVLHVILADEGFALHDNVMKSYPRKATITDRSKLTYNFRHSHVRRVSENAFGILCAIFRIVYTPIHCSTDHINNITMAACILYNLLRNEVHAFNCDHEILSAARAKYSTI